MYSCYVTVYKQSDFNRACYLVVSVGRWGLWWSPVFENSKVWHCCLLKLVYIPLLCDFWAFIQGWVGLTCLGLALWYVQSFLALSKKMRTWIVLLFGSAKDCIWAVFESRLAFVVELVQCFPCWWHEPAAKLRYREVSATMIGQDVIPEEYDEIL